MDIAIIGLPQCGKTTLFNALTRDKANTTGVGGAAGQMHVGVVKVPDPRLDVLREMYRRPKAVHVEIKYWDLPGPESLARSQGLGGKHRNILQGAHAFLLAAGTIHSDFHRGFIRAEVIPFDDLVRCGSIAQGRKEGVLRSEGKSYQVRDGDVIHFLVNV